MAVVMSRGGIYFPRVRYFLLFSPPLARLISIRARAAVKQCRNLHRDGCALGVGLRRAPRRPARRDDRCTHSVPRTGFTYKRQTPSGVRGKEKEITLSIDHRQGLRLPSRLSFRKLSITLAAVKKCDFLKFIILIT